MVMELWHGLQKGPIADAFSDIVHEWNVAHEDCQFELKGSEIYGKPAEEALKTEDEKQPSIVLAPEYMTSTMLQAIKDKKIIPINKLVGDETLEKIALIVRKTFAGPDGNLVSLPFNPACGVIYTNKDLMQKIGRDPDFVPSSMEELEDVSRELISKGYVDAGYTTAWPAAYLVEIPAALQDKALIDPDNGKQGFGDYILNRKWLVDHLKDIKRQQSEGVYAYRGRTNTSMDDFVAGKIAFFMQGSTHKSWLESRIDGSFSLGSGSLPTLLKGQKEKFAFPLGGASLWVLNNEKTKEMIGSVKEFLSYLASREVQKNWHMQTAYVPAIADLKEDLEDFYEDNPHHRAVLDQTINAPLGKHSFGIHMPNYNEARKELFEVIERVLDTNTKEEEIEGILQEFDEKYSILK